MSPLLLRPKRPFRSLIDFRNRTLWTSGAKKFFAEHPNKWPCLLCDGIGSVRDPADDVEMRERMPCSDCGGKRWWPRERFVAAYKAIIDKFKQDLRDYLETMQLRKFGLAKLTPEERQALGV